MTSPLLSTLYEHAAVITLAAASTRSSTTTGHAHTCAATDDRVRRLAVAGPASPRAKRSARCLEQHPPPRALLVTANTGWLCHTNIRLFPDQLAYIVNHAGDKVFFIDPGQAWWSAAGEPETVECLR
jgi:fatty-acyl-CoA synthase